MAQVKTLCNVVQQTPDNIAQVKTLCDATQETPDNIAQETQCRLNNIAFLCDFYFGLVNFLDNNLLLQMPLQHCKNLSDIAQEKSWANIEQKDKIVPNKSPFSNICTHVYVTMECTELN